MHSDKPKQSNMPFPIVHINGFPGIGKLTIARQLVDLLLCFNAKLVHNHLLIDPAGAVLPRSSEDYQPLRRAIRATIFNTLAKSSDTFDSVYVFTDFQSNDEEGTSVIEEYRAMAAHRKCNFVPIILKCSKEENLKRLVTAERSTHGKLTDLELVSSIRDNEVVHLLPGEMELDITTLDAWAAARLIYTYVLDVCPELMIAPDKQANKAA